MSSEDETRKVLDYAATRCGIKNWSYSSEHLDRKIENYFGDLVPVTLRGFKDDAETLLHVMIKTPPQNPTQELLDIVEPFYEREISVYEYIFPFYRSMKTNIKIEQLIPDCYYLNRNLKEAVLVLQDMRYEGFERCRNDKFLDFEHMEVSLRSLAQFHALSIISQEKGIRTVDRSLLPTYKTSLPLFSKAVEECFNNNCGLFQGTEHNEFVSYIKNNVRTILETCALSSKVKCTIYGHGDFWRENILFEYKEETPTKACVIDFQGTREMSPAQDLLYFILSSSDPSTRKQNFKKYIDIYYDFLSKYLSDNCIKNEVFSRIDLEHDLKYVAPVCFLLAFFSIAMWHGMNVDDTVKSKLTHRSEIERKKYEDILRDLISSVHDDLKYFDLIDL